MENKQKKRTTPYSTIAVLLVAAVSVTVTVAAQETTSRSSPIEVGATADAPARLDNVPGPVGSDPVAAYDPTFPILEDPVWAAIDAGSLDVRTSSAAPDSEAEAQLVDYSSMWRYLNSDFGVEHQLVDYSSMWRYLNSDYLGPVVTEQDPVWTVVDAGSLGAITSGEPASQIRRDSDDQAGEMLGMIDPSPLPEDRFPS